MEGSGNDFVVMEDPRSQAPGPELVQRICDRIFGVGADGILLLGRSLKADVRMRVFNADGSEAEMCGNGARCCALYVSRKNKTKKVVLETMAGVLEAGVDGDDVNLKMTDPLDLRLGMTVKVEGREYEVDYLNTGVPHAIIETDDLENVPVRKLGRLIRHHGSFRPAGTNVDFIKVEDKDRVSVRTYERGVEDETLACGTGAVAAAVIATLNHTYKAPRPKPAYRVFVKTRSSETLKVYFKLLKKKITDVWLEGKARIVYRGEYFI